MVDKQSVDYDVSIPFIRHFSNDVNEKRPRFITCSLSLRLSQLPVRFEQVPCLFNGWDTADSVTNMSSNPHRPVRRLRIQKGPYTPHRERYRREQDVRPHILCS